MEAALALSLFLFGMAVLTAPMKLLNEHRKLFMALEAACEEVSEYAYLDPQLPVQQEKEKSVESGQGLPEVLSGGLTRMGVLIYAEQKVKKAVNPRAIEQISLLRSSVLEDGETIDLIVDCKLKLPFSVFLLQRVPMTVRSRRRAWIGRNGGEVSGGQGAEGDDTIVYVGKSSTRYHISRTCHYLYHDCAAVSFDEIATLRNQEGRRYAPCVRCGASAAHGSTVYIMQGGTSYHSDRYCSAIVSYVRAVRLSEVEYLGPCSYCSD